MPVVYEIQSMCIGFLLGRFTSNVKLSEMIEPVYTLEYDPKLWSFKEYSKLITDGTQKTE